MKKSFLFGSVVAALMSLAGCQSPIPDVSVADVAKDLAPGSFAGTVTRSRTVVDGLTITVDEWTITDAEKATIAHTAYSFGDKAHSELSPVSYTFEMQSLVEGNLGCTYSFIPQADGGEALSVLYWGNSLIIGKDTISGASAPIANLKKIEANFPNHAWETEETEYFINYDTTEVIKRDTIKHVEVIDGKRQWVIDKINVDTLLDITSDTIAPKNVHFYQFAFWRDNTTYENTGMRLERIFHYALNEAGDAIDPAKTEIETIYDMNFHWGLAQITSATRFALYLQDDATGEITRVSLSGLDVEKKNVVNISNIDYHMAEMPEPEPVK